MNQEMFVICEGPSECAFVKQILVPYIGARTSWELTLIPHIVISSENRKYGKKYTGGLLNYQRTKNDILNCMRVGRPVTTMFDLYALPSNFPGREESKTLPSGSSQVALIENMLKTDLEEALPDYPKRWIIPYIQLHEFETLFYVDLQALKTVYLENEKAVDRLQNEVKGMSPEDINNGPETAPSKRLLKCLPYKKGIEVVAPLKEIGIERMMQSCPHFGQWVEQILKFT